MNILMFPRNANVIAVYFLKRDLGRGRDVQPKLIYQDLVRDLNDQISSDEKPTESACQF